MWEVKFLSSDSPRWMETEVNELCKRGWEPVGISHAVSDAYNEFTVMLRRKKEQA